VRQLVTAEIRFLAQNTSTTAPGTPNRFSIPSSVAAYRARSLVPSAASRAMMDSFR
jgi:hypothetical protein